MDERVTRGRMRRALGSDSPETEADWRKREVEALERIADALESLAAQHGHESYQR